MTLTESLYRDSLLSWLRGRRDHQDNTPEPEMPTLSSEAMELVAGGPTWLSLPMMRHYNRVRAEVLRDWERHQ